MDELMMEVAVRKLRSYLPETQKEAEELATLIEKAIDRETDRGIRGLSVAVEDGGILLSGHCESFYCKQLAQHAAMAISGSERLINGIEVS